MPSYGPVEGLFSFRSIASYGQRPGMTEKKPAQPVLGEKQAFPEPFP